MFTAMLILLGLLVITPMVLVFVGAKSMSSAISEKQKLQARRDELGPQYESALADLKAEPSRDNRIKVLEIGKEYVKACALDAKHVFNEGLLNADLETYGSGD